MSLNMDTISDMKVWIYWSSCRAGLGNEVLDLDD